MFKDLDAEMDALNARKTKGAMKFVLTVSPEGEVEVEKQGAEAPVAEAPIKAELDEQEDAEEGAKEQAESPSEDEVTDEQVRGGISDEATLEEFKDKAPRSLGERVRLAIAKKQK